MNLVVAVRVILLSGTLSSGNSAPGRSPEISREYRGYGCGPTRVYAPHSNRAVWPSRPAGGRGSVLSVDARAGIHPNNWWCKGVASGWDPPGETENTLDVSPLLRESVRPSRTSTHSNLSLGASFLDGVLIGLVLSLVVSVLFGVIGGFFTGLGSWGESAIFALEHFFNTSSGSGLQSYDSGLQTYYGSWWVPGWDAFAAEFGFLVDAASTGLGFVLFKNTVFSKPGQQLSNQAVGRTVDIAEGFLGLAMDAAGAIALNDGDDSLSLFLSIWGCTPGGWRAFVRFGARGGRRSGRTSQNRRPNCNRTRPIERWSWSGDYHTRQGLIRGWTRWMRV
jgi:hypothetical protein